jgi:hypothetical protein
LYPLPPPGPYNFFSFYSNEKFYDFLIENSQHVPPVTQEFSIKKS